jgi:1-acyl-sn-glycerol-3-phosphate acyltransferase
MRKLILGFTYVIVMRLFLKVIVGVKLVNRASLKKKKQFILVSNHNSHLDTMALMSSMSWKQLPNTHPVAAGDYFGNSPVKAFFTRLFTNAILITRSKEETKENPIEQMSAALENGKSLILFPEGSRGEPEKMQEFKKGIGILLQKHPEIPFIPVYMNGMGKVLPKGERLLVPFDSYVVFGEPTFRNSDEVEAIVKEVETEILSLKKQFIENKSE